EARPGALADFSACAGPDCKSVAGFALASDLMDLLAVRRQDHAEKGQPVRLDQRIACQWRAAGTVEGCQERALASQRLRRRLMRDRAQKLEDRRIADPAFDADRPLPWCRGEAVHRQEFGDD